jgi:hypothetical protein
MLFGKNTTRLTDLSIANQKHSWAQIKKIYNSINFILYFATNHNKTRRKIKII